MKILAKCTQCDDGPCFVHAPKILVQDAAKQSGWHLPTDCTYGYADAYWEPCLGNERSKLLLDLLLDHEEPPND